MVHFLGVIILYVEQKARQALYDIAPKPVDAGSGWSRFYKAGAAICWLLDKVYPEWTTFIENGKSLGDLLLEWEDSSMNLDLLDYDAVRQSEQEKCEQIRQQINAELEAFQQQGIIRIHYPTDGQVFRAFNPSTLISLGDGRILHRSFFQLLIPSNGKVAVTGSLVIDNVANSELQISSFPLTYREDNLRVDTSEAQIILSGVVKQSAGVYEITVGAKNS